VRHIPEDELHAYLDQALSRSQCVEIERHLARCPGCQELRDDIAALRDRTTALLARIGPPPILPPAFEIVRAAARLRERRRWRLVSGGAWAAGIAAALTLGWLVNFRLQRTAGRPTAPETPVAVVPDQPRTQPIPPAQPAPAASPRVPRPKPASRQLVRVSHPGDTPSVTGVASAIETDPSAFFGERSAELVTLGSAPPLDGPELIAQPVGTDPGLHGLWRTIVPDSGAARGADVALVPGLPVLQMRVQPGSGGEDVTAVDQMLESGDWIRTISGPAGRVLTLVNEDARADTASSPPPVGTGSRMTVTIRQADRMVAVTGPSQALGSLLSRVNIRNAKRRY
jgi:anti-sigma factor RsiW